jgi:hypothetical protein
MLAMAKTPVSEPLQTALAFLRRTAELAGDDTRALDAGCVVRTPSLPLVWVLNHLRLSGSTAYAQAVALAEGLAQSRLRPASFTATPDDVGGGQLAAGHPPSARRRRR